MQGRWLPLPIVCPLVMTAAFQAIRGIAVVGSGGSGGVLFLLLLDVPFLIVPGRHGIAMIHGAVLQTLVVAALLQNQSGEWHSSFVLTLKLLAGLVHDRNRLSCPHGEGWLSSS